MFADTHCHPQMKYLHDDNNEIWKSCKAPLKLIVLLNTLLGIAAFSQSDFCKMVRGNVQLVFSALHPPEQKILQHNLTNSSMEDDLETVAAQIISITEDKINPVIAFKRSARFAGFKRQLTKRLKKDRFEAFRDPQFSEFLADRICFWNVYHFLERNF